MKRTRLRRIGKHGLIWWKAKQKLKEVFIEKGITTCELRFPGCWHDDTLAFAHKEKRAFYRTRPKLLGSFSHVLLACNFCHDKIENDRELTEKMFALKRPLLTDKKDV
jgi:hypothetical protein